MTRSKTLAVTLALAVVTPALANPEDPDLHSWGKLAPFKKTEFFQLSYKARAGDEKKAKPKKAFLSLADDTEFFLDRQVPLDFLQTDAKVWIYGKPAERESQSSDGQTQVDRQILNTLAIAVGEGLVVKVDPKAKGPAEQIWLQATVTKGGQALHVQYDGNEYKVVCLKSFAVLSRQALTEPPKLKKSVLVEVMADSSDKLPENAKEDDVAFTVRRLIVLDKRLQKSVYPLLLPR